MRETNFTIGRLGIGNFAMTLGMGPSVKHVLGV